MTWEAFAALLALVALVATWLGGWASIRRSELRRDEVLGWANDAIACMQTIVLLVNPRALHIPIDEKGARLTALAIDASVLIERGRLFFRNQIIDDFGEGKEPAYKGYRPLILDELLVIYEIASTWHALEPDDYKLTAGIAESCERRFVSLVQQEVGRDRTVSNYTAQGGDGAHFSYLLHQAKAGRVIRRQPISENGPSRWRGIASLVRRFKTTIPKV